MKLKLLIAILTFPLSLMAARTNEFSYVLVNNDLTTTNLYVRSMSFTGTNAIPAYGSAIWRALSAARPYWIFDSGSTSIDGQIFVGNIAGTDAITIGNDGSGNIRFVGQGATVNFGTSSGGLNFISPNIISGVNSSSMETHLGITDTRPNGWLVNGHAPATVIVTNVSANFPSILAAQFADLTFPVIGSTSNMVVSVGNPTAEDGSLAVNAFVSAIGTVTLRARNVGSLAVDQADLPYRLQLTASPTANSP